jgi:cell division protease FtsH
MFSLTGWGKPPPPQTPFDVIQRHFRGVPPDQLIILERTFPFRVRADLQSAIDAHFQTHPPLYSCSVQSQYEQHFGLKLSSCMTYREHDMPLCAPLMFEEVDVGDGVAVRCLRNAFWIAETAGCKLAVLLSTVGNYAGTTGLRIEFAGRNDETTQTAVQAIFRMLELAVNQSRCYRGKILSLEGGGHEHSYSGTSGGIRVHRLREVAREQVVLPSATVELLERNVIGFVQRRNDLKQRGLSARKGLLFYGPPGTGKTHTIHYLTRALPGHTTLIITAEQVGLLEEYMTLARLMQPSIVVMEDVDLIARDRTHMNSPCEEALLNKLLNHMDGLQEDADVLFILTTNRPEMLEPALAARPGRIDQAIEFPLPDVDGRRQLVAMYAAGVTVPEEVAAGIVQKTAGVSAAFIKELMRRAYQFHLEANGTEELGTADVDAALDEMLFRGGALNRVLLGAGTVNAS